MGEGKTESKSAAGILFSLNNSINFNTAKVEFSLKQNMKICITYIQN